MSETITKGWLTDDEGTKFAPKTTVDQVLNADGTKYKNTIEDRFDSVEEAIKTLSNATVYGYHVNENESDPYESVTYIKDAVGMTPAKMNYTSDSFEYGSWFDAFFLPRPCMLKFDGTVDYYLDPNDLSKKEDGTDSDVANVEYGGNAMVEWGKNGKKIWKKKIADADGNGYSVYISDTQRDSEYNAWSFINNQNKEVDHFYTPIYNGSLDSNGRLRSLSGQQIMHSKTAQQEVEYAKANNVDDNVIWYTETFADCDLINDLLVLMGKSLDTEAVFGQGHTTGGSQEVLEAERTGSLDTKGMFYGSNGTTTNMKVFFMENYWGCQWRRIAGLMVSANKYYYKLTYGTADGSGLESYGFSVDGMLDGGATPTSSGWISGCKVLNKSVLVPSTVGGSASTYYCDYFWINANTNYAFRGGSSDFGSACGAFYLFLYAWAGATYWVVGAALSCKPLAR